jgi:hypothetical protein
VEQSPSTGQERDDDASAAGGGGVMPAEPAPDRVAVVRPADADEDIGAWDVAGGALPWGTWAPGRISEDDESEHHTPDYVERETSPWEFPMNHSAARSTAEASVGPTPRFIDGAEFLPRAFEEPDEPLCSAAEPEEQDAREVEDAQAEENAAAEEDKERTSADLLKQDHDAWAAVTGPKRPGVIE